LTRWRLFRCLCWLGLLWAAVIPGRAAQEDVTDDPVENEMLNVTNSVDQLLDTHIADLDELGAILLAFAIICRFVGAAMELRHSQDIEPVL
jgi:hypothetical protein